MTIYFSHLADINRRLQEANRLMREQYNLVRDVDCPRSHQARLRLLSIGLRVFCWLEDRRREQLEGINEYYRGDENKDPSPERPRQVGEHSPRKTVFIEADTKR